MTRIWIVFSFMVVLAFSSNAYAACADHIRHNCPPKSEVQKRKQGGFGGSVNLPSLELARGHRPGAAARRLIPVRQYLRAQDIPPADVGAYGLVVFQTRPTPANQKKLTMVCKSFIAAFPRSETAIVPVSDQMITIWPLDEPDAAKAKVDDCDFILQHYDLNASESAANDVRIQGATIDGEGPYLVGWSPSNTRGMPDKLVLVVDMSADNNQDAIDHKFLFWKNKIIQNPALWRSGWSLEALRVAIKDFSDQYGKEMLDAIKLIGGKTP